MFPASLVYEIKLRLTFAQAPGESLNSWIQTMGYGGASEVLPHSKKVASSTPRFGLSVSSFHIASVHAWVLSTGRNSLGAHFRARCELIFSI